MPAYRVVVKPSVERDLHSVPPEVVARVFDAIDGLRAEPFPRGSVKLVGTERLYVFELGSTE
jgi:mRNA-degrading endonuclease RelE of RelBE toxin-antitoxin system